MHAEHFSFKKVINICLVYSKFILLNASYLIDQGHDPQMVDNYSSPLVFRPYLSVFEVIHFAFAGVWAYAQFSTPLLVRLHRLELTR